MLPAQPLEDASFEMKWVFAPLVNTVWQEWQSVVDTTFDATFEDQPANVLEDGGGTWTYWISDSSVHFGAGDKASTIVVFEDTEVDFIEFPTIRQWNTAGFQIWINNGTFNPGLDDCIFDGNVDDAVFYPGGDANLDVVFDSTDLIEVMAAGLYETGRLAEWASGDWNGDRKFDSGDLVRAFAEGRYSSGAQASPATANRIVPEPAMLPWLALVGIACGLRRRKGVQSKSKLIHAR